jgi:hypothetical protein
LKPCVCDILKKSLLMSLMEREERKKEGRGDEEKVAS